LAQSFRQLVSALYAYLITIARALQDIYTTYFQHSLSSNPKIGIPAHLNAAVRALTLSQVGAEAMLVTSAMRKQGTHTHTHTHTLLS
jgi:hypothetical protein